MDFFSKVNNGANAGRSKLMHFASLPLPRQLIWIFKQNFNVNICLYDKLILLQDSRMENLNFLHLFFIQVHSLKNLTVPDLNLSLASEILYDCNHSLSLYFTLSLQVVFIDHSSQTTSYIDPRVPYPGREVLTSLSDSSSVGGVTVSALIGHTHTP